MVSIVKKLTNGYGAHAAICLSSSQEGYKQSLSLLRHRGTLVCIGLARDYLPSSPFDLIVKGITVIGSSVGTKTEMNDLLAMAARGDITPIVKEYAFEKLDEVLKLVEQNKVAGRAVIKIPG